MPIIDKSAAVLSGAFFLPGVKGWAERQFADFLTPDGAPVIDFTQPKGAEALVGADSVSWQVFANPITLFMGGIAAVLLELSEPRVGHGVWQFSDFRKDPKARLQRTGLAAMVTVYAPRETAERMIARVVKMHSRVEGVTDEGVQFTANDPDLLTWVQATAMFGFIEAYQQYAVQLSDAEIAQFWQEAAPAAALYGATTMPTDPEGVQGLFDRVSPSLKPHGRIDEFLNLMSRAAILPRVMRPLQTSLIRAAVSLVPEDIRLQIEIDRQWWATSWDEKIARLLAQLAGRLKIQKSPVEGSIHRLGLPESHHYPKGN